MPSSAQNASGSNATYTWSDATKACSNDNLESRIPNIDELSAMHINKDIVNLTVNKYFWSGTSLDSSRAYLLSTYVGHRLGASKTEQACVRCVRR